MIPEWRQGDRKFAFDGNGYRGRLCELSRFAIAVVEFRHLDRTPTLAVPSDCLCSLPISHHSRQRSLLPPLTSTSFISASVLNINSLDSTYLYTHIQIFTLGRLATSNRPNPQLFLPRKTNFLYHLDASSLGFVDTDTYISAPALLPSIIAFLFNYPHITKAMVSIFLIYLFLLFFLIAMLYGIDI